jgi:hypothetical protein
MNNNHEELDWDDAGIEKTLKNHLETFEESLQCPICQDFCDNPQILSTCGHSFCALCIRRHFDRSLNRSTFDICPSCRVKGEINDLKKNITLSNAVIQYKQLRNTLFSSLKENSSRRLSSSPSVSSSSTFLASKYNEILGYKITSKVPPFHYHGLNKEKIKKYLDELTKHSRIKLRIDGCDKDMIEKRIRDLVHVINAQVDADQPLSLDAVIKKQNDEEESRLYNMRKEKFAKVRIIVFVFDLMILNFVCFV